MSLLIYGVLVMTAVHQCVQSQRMVGLTGSYVHNANTPEIYRSPWNFYEGYNHMGFPLVLARGAVQSVQKQPQFSDQQPRTNSFSKNFGNINRFGNANTPRRSVGVKVQNLPLPVVANRPVPVRIKNTSLKFNVGKSVLPVGVVNRTLSVKVADLPLPVGIANQRLNVNVQNLPLRTIVDQPVEVTSDQLGETLKSIDADVAALKTLLKNLTTTNRVIYSNSSAQLVNVTVQNLPLPVTVVNQTLPVELSKLPVPVVVNQTLLVELSKLPVPVVADGPLPVELSKLPVPVVADGPLPVELSKLPVPVVVNQTLPVELSKLPVPVVADGPLPVELSKLPVPVVANAPLPVELSKLPVPVVANVPIPVTIANGTSLNFSVGDSVLPVGIVNRTLTVDLATLPLPVGIANQTLNVNVNNLPLRTTVEQPVEITSGQLVTGLSTVEAEVKALKTLLQIFSNSKPANSTSTSVQVVNVTVKDLPLPVMVVNKTLAVELSKLPVPVVADVPLPVTIKDTSLNVSVGNSILPVGVVNRTLTVDVATLPLPVGIANQTLNVNVNNLPLRTTVDQPVEVTSNQLVANLTAIDADIKALKTLLEKKDTNAKLCPITAAYATTYCFPTATSCICLITNRIQTFAGATTFCKEYGFDGLASLQTKSKASFVTDLFSFYYAYAAWTSGSDSGSTFGTFAWKTTGEAFTDTMWAPGEPTGRSDSSCVQVFTNGTWKTEPCSSNATSFFCERAQFV